MPLEAAISKLPIFLTDCDIFLSLFGCQLRLELVISLL